jgi:hypothetical protein
MQDINMPILDGYAASKMIRAFLTVRDQPWIVGAVEYNVDGVSIAILQQTTDIYLHHIDSHSSDFNLNG